MDDKTGSPHVTDPRHEAIYILIAQAGKVDRVSIRLEMNLRTDLGLDSLTLVSLMMRCGEELGIDPDELIERVPVEKISTVADLLAMGAAT
jgi:acyl carrier protein